MPSQYPGGQSPYPTQVFFVPVFKLSLIKKGATPLLILEISLKQGRWSVRDT